MHASIESLTSMSTHTRTNITSIQYEYFQGETHYNHIYFIQKLENG